MTNEELRADLLGDPATAELAAEQGMTVDGYIAATLAFCDDPDAGFAGEFGEPDCCPTNLEAMDETSAFERRRLVVLPNAAPGEGVTGSAPAFVPRARTFRG